MGGAGTWTAVAWGVLVGWALFLGIVAFRHVQEDSRVRDGMLAMQSINRGVREAFVNHANFGSGDIPFQKIGNSVPFTTSEGEKAVLQSFWGNIRIRGNGAAGTFSVIMEDVPESACKRFGIVLLESGQWNGLAIDDAFLEAADKNAGEWLSGHCAESSRMEFIAGK